MVAGADEIWARLVKLIELKAPGWQLSLRSPVSLDQLAAAEKALGFLLPEEVREAYLHHDGQSMPSDPFFFTYWWIPLEQLVEEWEINREVSESLQQDSLDNDDLATGDGKINTSENWPKQWIPIGRDGCGGNIFADYCPGSAGSLGQLVSRFDGVPLHGEDVIAQNLREYLHRLIDCLENGRIRSDGKSSDGELIRIFNFNDVWKGNLG